MRLLFIVMFSLLSSSIYAQEFTITDSAYLSDSILPDTMKSSISLSFKGSDFRSVSARMEEASSVLKSTDICSYKSYSVTPRYSYSGNTRRLDGYIGHLNSPCIFKDISRFEKAVASLSSLLGFDMSTSPIHWTVSSRTADSVKTSLKHKLIKLIADSAQSYSRSTKMECTLKSVAFNTPYIPVRDSYASMSAKSMEISAPDRDTQDISVTAAYTLICR